MAQETNHTDEGAQATRAGASSLGAQRKRRYSFFATLMTSGIMAMLVFVAGFGFSINYYVRPSLERQWGSTTEILAMQYASLAGVSLSEVGQSLALFGMERAPAEGKAQMSSWIEGQKLASAMYWVDFSGTVAAAISRESKDTGYEGATVAGRADYAAAEAGGTDWGSSYKSSVTGAQVVARYVKVPSGYLVLEVDQERLSEKLRNDAGSSEKMGLALLDSKGGVVAYSKPSLGEALSARSAQAMAGHMKKAGKSDQFVDVGMVDGRPTLARFVDIPGVRGWKAAVLVDSATVFESLASVAKLLAAAVLLAAGAGAVGLFALAKSLSNGMLSLEHRAKALARGEDASGLELGSPIAEIASVGESLDAMFLDLRARQRDLIEHQQDLERLVAERTEGLTKANGELATAFDALKRAQESLVESEKMASLGHLVAGVAHELNTPIGNAYLSSTALEERIEGLREAVVSGRVNKREFQERLDSAAQLARLARLSLERSADLIKSFKRVAVDQSAQKVSTFDLTALAKDAMASFQAGLDKRGGASWKVVGDPLEVTSNAGAWIQMLANFYNNALMHAFDGGRQGNIEVLIKGTADDEFELVFSDDGAGMSEEVRKKAFDPFFTTKPGMGGGSGIGLHLCFNLAKSALGGHLWIASSPGGGTKLIVRAPRRLPGEESVPGSTQTFPGSEPDCSEQA